MKRKRLRSIRALLVVLLTIGAIAILQRSGLVSTYFGGTLLDLGTRANVQNETEISPILFNKRTIGNVEQTKTKQAGGIRPEVHHIAFLKVHKAASSTIQNILYRFGLRRNLTFVLPKGGHYLSKQKYLYRDVLPSLYKSGKYDIVCNHAVFNLEYFEQYMHPDAVYLAIVREPFDLLESAAMYYKYVWPTSYLKEMNVSTLIEDLISNPEIHEPPDLKDSRTFNYMTRDFGFILKSVEDSNKISDQEIDMFIAQMDDVFDLVLIVERFDESLVMLKRRLGWTTKDIIYVTKNARKPKLIQTVNLDERTMEKFRHLYRFDYKLYDFFTRKFNEKVKSENLFNEEVESFKKILGQVQQLCEVQSDESKFIVDKTSWNDEFTVSGEDCNLMRENEISFWRKLTTIHNSAFQHQKQEEPRPILGKF